VPALVVGHLDRFQVAVFPESYGHDSERAVYSDDECWELLHSLDEFLPQMLPAYYEQIANYLRSVFFAGQDYQTMAFCLRIRQIATASIRGKLDLIEKPKYPDGKSGRLARKLAEKYAAQIKEGRAVDAFAHLIVNYIYRFYCIQDRIPDYDKRLASVPSSRTLFTADSVSFMQECARNLKNPKDEFHRQLGRDKETRDPWLQTMGEISAFVAEIVHSLDGKGVDAPRVFVTYHFKVKDSERFVDLATRTLELNKDSAELVVGRHVRRDIRWSLLARIWMADHHLLFLPSTWERTDHKRKSLKLEKNWVVMELFYGRLLGRDISLVVASPTSEAVLDEFRNHIKSYTEEKEIPHVPEAGWHTFVRRSKEYIANLSHELKRLPCNLDEFETNGFWAKFKEYVIEKAARSLVRVLFGAWYCFFDAKTWSVVQALILLGRQTGQRSFTVRQLAEYLRAHADSNGAFQWTRSYPDLPSLEEALRRNHLGRPKDFGTLRQFAFVQQNRPFYPVVGQMKGNRMELQLRTWDLYAKLSTRFGIPQNQAEYEEIVQALLAPRPED